MAIRRIRLEDDKLLRKQSRDVENINKKILSLLDDMKETLASQNGLGIAAPQVGVLKKVFIAVDNKENPIEIINPILLESRGSQKNSEGCLSVKSIRGIVDRPEYVKLKALDRFGNEIIIEGRKRFATVLSHELDHLEGILFIDKIIELDKQN